VIGRLEAMPDLVTFDVTEELYRIVRLINSRGGLAGTFAKEDEIDQRVLENLTTREFVKSLRAVSAVCIEAIEPNSNPKKAPDCFGWINGSRASIELTEMVDEALLEEIQASFGTATVVSPYHGAGFYRSQWTSKRLDDALTKRVRAKSAKYERIGLDIDYLVVHTDETRLTPHQVAEWLPELNLSRAPRIRHAFLLMTYDPSFTQTDEPAAARLWPLFRLF